MKSQRSGLLAKIHIAKDQLGLSEEEYRAILKGLGVNSAAHLSVPKMEIMVKYLMKLGFRPLHRGWYDRNAPPDARIAALRHRARDIAAGLHNGDKRLAALVKKICSVDALDWCRDEKKLKRLVKVLGEIQRQAARGGAG